MYNCTNEVTDTGTNLIPRNIFTPISVQIIPLPIIYLVERAKCIVSFKPTFFKHIFKRTFLDLC